MAIYSIGTSAKYDALPLMPLFDSTTAGIRLNSNISMPVGAKVEYGGLEFRELTFATSRTLFDARDTSEPRSYSVIFNGSSNVSTSANVSTTPATIVGAVGVFVPFIYTYSSSGLLGTFFANRSQVDLARCLSKSITVKNAGGTVVWKWLDQVSDYKSTPPNGSIVGTPNWYKQGTDGNEMVNYLTQQLLIAAVPNPAGHVVEVLDRSTPVDLLLAGGYTVQYTYAPAVDEYENFSYKWSY